MSENGLMLKKSPAVGPRMQFEGFVPEDSGIVSPSVLGDRLDVVSDRKVEFTTVFATKLLELPEFVVNDTAIDRTLRDNHVTFLLNAAKRGTFHPEWVTIITCVCDEPLNGNASGTEFRMNGQHTGWMRLGMPDDWPCPVRYIKYRAKTVEDMRILYVSIDRGAPRTAGNVITGYLAGTEAFKGANQRIIQVLAAGLTHWLWGSTAKKWSHADADTQAVLMQTTYRDVSVAIKDWFIATPLTTEAIKILRRSAVVGAMYETFSKLPTKAHEFWNVVRDGIGATGTNDPRHRLREKLRGTSLTIGRKPNTGKQSVDAETMYRWAILCWNAWRRGDELSSIKSSSSEVRPKAK